MRSTAPRIVVIAAVGLCLLAPPVLAEEDGTWQERMDGAGESLVSSLNTLMQLLKKAVKDVPQYEAPEMLENGDIIIRRKQPEAEEEGGAIQTSAPAGHRES